MKVVIIGAGISGLLSAYYLIKRGHNVHIIESSKTVASMASGANAAQLSYTYVNPIASPSLISMLPSILLGKVPGFQLKRYDLDTLAWGSRLLLEARQSKFLENRSKLLKRSLESRALFADLMKDTGITFKGHSKGKMQLFHTELLEESAQLFSKELKEYGISQQWLARKEITPLLGSFELDKTTLSAVYSYVDETASCPDFCQDLLNFLIQQKRFEISFDRSIKRWHKKRGKIVTLETDSGSKVESDMFLLCTGAQTNHLVRQIGLKYPIYPVKGYTLVYNMKTDLKCSVTDHKHKVVFVPLDDKLMVSGMFHVGASMSEIDENAVAYIHQSASRRIAELAEATYEVKSGLRPCTPSSLPIIAKTKYHNLFINSGQGMYGWTLSTSCAEEIAAMISGDV